MTSTAYRVLRFAWHPRTRYVYAWLLLLLIAGFTIQFAWTAFASPQRRDGNYGHTTIDFGGQWTMGRMLAKGLGQHLYHRNFQREVLREAYLQEDEVPDSERIDEEKGKHDADNLMGWFMGKDASAGGPDQPPIGGPLYPPIHALLMAPLGNLRPALAYRVLQGVIVLMAFVAGWGIRQLSHGRIWWPIAVSLIVLFPAFTHSLNLGQNSALLLALLVWGWLFISRGRQMAGGVLWGLLAFKPVWPAAFLLVPLLTGRWRVCLAMVATGAALAVATLPLVGLHSWFEWLWIGKQATFVYNVDENWVFLSRDLLTIPKRWLVNFEAPDTERFNWSATLLGWGLVIGVFTVTILLAVLRKDRGRALHGPAATFLLLGAFLSCYHFMYYDSLLAALPVALFFLEPGQFSRPRLVAVVPLGSPTIDKSVETFYQPRLLGACSEAVGLLSSPHRHVFVLNSLALSLLAILLASETLLATLNISASVSVPALNALRIPMPLRYSTGLAGTPLSTFCLLIFWAWAGWLWFRSPIEQKPPEEKTIPSSDSAGVSADTPQLV